MSPLQKTGVQLVAEGESSFSAALSKASGNVTGFASQADKAAASMGRVSDGTNKAQQVFNLATAVTIGLGTAMGSILAGGIGAVVSGITNFIGSGIQAVSAIQDLQINLETLAAREILYTGTTDNMTEALAMGVPVAARMMEALKNLSIQSPFQYQQIMEVFQMNMAFGQSSDMALELTRAITNLGAVNKGIPGILQRLSYNFSQMSMVGQITARDVRDLAMAGLDLKKVLQLQLGMTMQEVNEKMKSGEMTFKEVAQALVDYTDKYVGPAAARASRTLGGLASTFKDVMFFASANLLKPAAENITVALGAMLDVLLAIVNSQAFQTMGVLLQALTQPIKSFGEWLAKTTAVTNTTKETFNEMPDVLRNMGVSFANPTPMDTFLSNMAKMAEKMVNYALDAMTWGINIVTQLATGIINATTSVLVSAINYVGQVLESWLGPGSPPKVAPDLDTWGMQAMREYLKGFTDADFSVLKAIQQPLQQAMQYAVSAGLMTGDEMNTVFASISRDLIGTIETGKGMEDMLVRIGQAAGPFAQEVVGITKSQFGLAAATKIAIAAQEKLTKAQQDYMTAGAKVSKGISEYNKLVKEGASKDILKAKLAQINADRQAQAAAAKGIGTAQTELEAAGKNIGTLQQSLALQQQMLEIMSQLARQTITTPAVEKAGGGAKAAGMGAPAATYTMPDTSGIESAITAQLDKLKEQISKKLTEAFAPITNLFNNTIGPAILSLQGAWDGLMGKFGLLAPKLQELQTLLGNWWLVLQQVWGAIVTTLQPAWEQLTATLGQSQIDWKTILDAIWSVVMTVINTIGWIFLGLVSIITGVVNGIISAWTSALQYSQLISDTLTMIWTGLKDFFTGIWDIIAGIFTLNGERIWEGIKKVFSGIWNFIWGILGLVFLSVVNYFSMIIAFISGFIKGVIGFFQNLYDSLVGKSIVPDMLQDIWDAFTTAFDNIITTVSQKVQGIIDTITGFIKTFVTAGSDVIGGLWQGIKDAWTQMLKDIGGLVDLLPDAVKKVLGISSPSKIFMEIGANVTTGLQEGIMKDAAAPVKATQDLVSQMMRAVVSPPARGRASQVAGSSTQTVTIQFGDVTITDPSEGQMFEVRVERAVRKAVGAGI